MFAHQTTEEAEIEIVIANAIADFAIEVLALCPEIADIDTFLDDIFGDSTPFVHQEEGALEHKVTLNVAG